MSRAEKLLAEREQRENALKYKQDAAEGIAVILDNARTDAEQLGMDADSLETEILGLLGLGDTTRLLPVGLKANPRQRPSRAKPPTAVTNTK